MKLYEVTYSGLWLGGVAIVFAETPEDAVKLVGEHQWTINFTNVSADELDQDGVVYNDNGDY